MMSVKSGTGHPEREKLLDETYDDMEDELERKIDGLKNQIALTADKRNTIIKVNRAAKTAMEVFNDILNKEKLDRNDLELIIDRIKVYEDHLEIQLKADIDCLLKSGELPEDEEQSVNFNSDIADSLQTTLVQSSRNRLDKVYDVNVISNGDPLEIYTEKDGEVIFKKYSPVGEISEFAATICEALWKAGDCACAVCDRDSVLACAGVPKKEVLERPVSDAVTELMEGRRPYSSPDGTELPLTDDADAPCVVALAPVLSEGDVLGCVAFVAKAGAPAATEVQEKIAAAVAAFLGKQMEN